MLLFCIFLLFQIKKQKILHWDDIASDVIITVASDCAVGVLNSAGRAIVGVTPIAAWIIKQFEQYH